MLVYISSHNQGPQSLTKYLLILFGFSQSYLSTSRYPTTAHAQVTPVAAHRKRLLVCSRGLGIRRGKGMVDRARGGHHSIIWDFLAVTSCEDARSHTGKTKKT